MQRMRLEQEGRTEELARKAQQVQSELSEARDALAQLQRERARLAQEFQESSVQAQALAERLKQAESERERLLEEHRDRHKTDPHQQQHQHQNNTISDLSVHLERLLSNQNAQQRSLEYDRRLQESVARIGQLEEQLAALGDQNRTLLLQQTSKPPPPEQPLRQRQQSSTGNEAMLKEFYGMIERLMTERRLENESMNAKIEALKQHVSNNAASEAATHTKPQPAPRKSTTPSAPPLSNEESPAKRRRKSGTPKKAATIGVSSKFRSVPAPPLPHSNPLVPAPAALQPQASDSKALAQKITSFITGPQSSSTSNKAADAPIPEPPQKKPSKKKAVDADALPQLLAQTGASKPLVSEPVPKPAAIFAPKTLKQSIQAKTQPEQPRQLTPSQYSDELEAVSKKKTPIIVEKTPSLVSAVPLGALRKQASAKENAPPLQYPHSATAASALGVSMAKAYAPSTSALASIGASKIIIQQSSSSNSGAVKKVKLPYHSNAISTASTSTSGIASIQTRVRTQLFSGAEHLDESVKGAFDVALPQRPTTKRPSAAARAATEQTLPVDNADHNA